MPTHNVNHDAWLELYPNVFCDGAAYPMYEHLDDLEPYISMKPWDRAPFCRLQKLHLPTDTTIAQLFVHDLAETNEEVADVMICEMTDLISSEEYPESPEGLAKFMAHYAAAHLCNHRFGVYSAICDTLVFGAKWWANEGDLLVISDFQSQLESDGYEVKAFTTDQRDMNAWAMVIGEVESDYCHTEFDNCTHRMASEFFKQPE